MSRRSKIAGRFRATAFVVVVPVLFLGSFLASRRAAPCVCIGKIKPRMNLSTMRVRGVLESDACRLQGGSVLYKVADETGSLPVFLDRAPSGLLPKAGCGIDVTGRLSVGVDARASMRVHDHRRIKVLEGGLPIVVQGRVSELFEPSPDSRAPCRIVLDRPEGLLDVVHWFPLEAEVAVGDPLEAEGILGFYNGRKQIKVGTSADIRLQSGR